MSKRKTGAMPTVQPKQEKKMMIDVNSINLKNSHGGKPVFRTGKYMTEKDRPRKKNWSREDW